MYLYEPFDYLCNEPFYLDGIGYVKCPTLRDIRNKTYIIFRTIVSVLTLTKEELIECYSDVLEQKNIDINEAKNVSKYDFLLMLDKNLLYDVISFFIVNKVEYKDNSFFTYITNEDNENIYLGQINSGNFDFFSVEVQKILGLKKLGEEKEQKFKNNAAKRMFEKLKKHSQEQKKKQDENYTLDNMIRKYCTHNKVGINIINVWDMTYYQFITMFDEYCNGRQCDFNDMMAANTFQYKKSTDYKPLAYIKKLNNN